MNGKNNSRLIFGLFAGLFCLLFSIPSKAIGPDQGKYIFLAGHEIISLSDSQDVLKITGSNTQYQSATILPIPIQNSDIALGILDANKRQLIFMNVLFSVFFLVLAHKNSFETGIYEFYHLDANGTVYFENTEVEKAHHFRSNLAKTLRVLGIITLFITIILIIL